ncbi:MAG: transaldolase family protein [Candidatus Bathyarchaeia archaeon]
MNYVEFVSSASPEELEFPAPSTDHSGHVVYLALKGHTKLAADHLLHTEMRGHLEETVGNVIRQLNLVFNRALLERTGERKLKQERSVLLCARVYDVLTQIALNLSGLERKMVGFSEGEVGRTLTKIRRALKDFENLERKGVLGCGSEEAPIAKAVINSILSEMKKVMHGYYRPPGSMAAHVAGEIEKGIDEGNIMESFLNSAREQIQKNLYYKLGEAGMCKFGNDYALGLRWLRHLGFVQVSTNPSLAAIAYIDDPSQWEGYRGENLCPDFKTISKEHPEWFENPEAYGDEMAAKGTEVSIWPNLAVFRPIAVASNMYHGMISLQLNPNVADSFEVSLRDALKIYADAEEFLRRYDQYLLWGYSENVERGRPNIVFKVAGSSPAAIDITRKLESLGIGTNNTVTFTVSQEVQLTLAKMEGRAEAVKKGIPLTTVYETNMGGRLDDHIREVQAEELLKKALEKVEDKEEALSGLAERLGALDEVKEKPSLEDKIRTVCSRRYLRPLNKEPFINFLAKNGVPSSSKEEVAGYLATLENDIGYCGILVTKRVYEIFFSPENRPKWIGYLQSKYGLTREQAEAVMRGIDVLPASKRKPKETLLTLGDIHMTHTEFPNHQMSMLMKSRESGFNIKEYKASVLKEISPEILRRLTEEWSDIKDLFVESYELTPSQQEVLKEAGILNAEKYGNRGLQPSEWRPFGATVKTMNEFSRSYEQFKKRCIEFIRKTSEEK